MSRNPPFELDLNSPVYEEDIGDLSPYIGLSSAASSTTLASSFATHSPRLLTDDDDGGDGDDAQPPLSSSTTDTPGNTPKKFAYPFVPPTSSSFSMSPSLSARRSQAPPPPRLVQIDAEALAKRTVYREIKALGLDSLDADKLRRWILGIAVVEFDLDHGPVVEGVYPPLPLTPAETENIAFSAFPDSLQFDQGTQTHSFRIREQFTPSALEKRPPTLDGFIYGFSYFIQRRDPTVKRGYQQRSVVILTHIQYPALFTALAAAFGPLFETHGIAMLEAACHNIATWPDPQPGQAIELGFLGTVFYVEIPISVDSRQLTETSSFNETYNPRSHILASTTPLTPPPVLLFEAGLSNLWSIWECLVLCEPILIFGTSPAQTSQAVWWLRDLLRPLPLAGDIRPYFTMQDSDNAQLVNKLPPKAGLILGVTNPFFEKSCAHWPHMLSLGKRVVTSNSPSVKTRSPSLGASAGPSPGWKTKTHKRYISKDRVFLKQLEDACLRGNDRMRMEASIALRRHFCSRTTHLITPLARYLNTLIPSPTEVRKARKASGFHIYNTNNTNHSSTSFSSSTSLPSGLSSSLSSNHAPTPHIPSSTPPPSLNLNLGLQSPVPVMGSLSGGALQAQGLRLKPFNNANFFASLKASGSTVLPFKSNSKKIEFYERWLKTPAFGAWLAQQEQVVQNVLNEQPTPSAPF